MFNLDEFIAKHVTNRETSMFLADIENNKEALTEKITGKSVLVVGGAGSIGSSFIKAILPFKPASLVVVDTNENALAELTRDLRSAKGMYVPNDYVPYPMDFCSPVFEKMFRKRGGFDIVGNFSAHKHVRSEKDIYSVEALLQNNVLHAKMLLDLLAEYPPEEYFCVSTDKEIPDKGKVEALFGELKKAFEKEETTKEEIIVIMKGYLPNFEHIETGKSLDSKM